MSEVRPVVTFASTVFNLTVEKPEFINPGNYGDDLAGWMVAELANAGIEVDPEVGQEDHGWYFNFTAGEPHCFIVGCRDVEPPQWVGWLERDRGFISSIFGGRGKGIQPKAALAIHRVFTSSPEIAEVRWHHRRDFDGGREELGRADPLAS